LEEIKAELEIEGLDLVQVHILDLIPDHFQNPDQDPDQEIVEV